MILRFSLSFALAFSGCMTVKLGAPKSLNPVMLGPVKSLGARADTVPQAQVTRTKLGVKARVFSSSDGAGNSSGSSSASIPNAIDIAVWRKTHGTQFDQFLIDRIDCNGYASFWGIILVAANQCNAETRLLDDDSFSATQ